MSEGRMTTEQTPDIETVLREAIVSGLRKCRHEEAPIPLAQEGNEHHVAFMALREVAPVLAAAVREARAAELREAADALGKESVAFRDWWKRPGCGPEDGAALDTVKQSTRWLRDRADRIAVDAPEGGA